MALSKKAQFSLKNAQKLEFSGNPGEVGKPGKKFCSGMDRIIECDILSYHTPLYLNVYGQAHQKSPTLSQKLEFSGNPGKNILLGDGPPHRIFWLGSVGRLNLIKMFPP